MKKIFFTKKTLPSFLGLFLVSMCLGLKAQTISVTLTKGDQSVRLAEQNTVSFSESSINNPTIVIDENKKNQTIDGFGHMLTQGSAKVIKTLDGSIQTALLEELYHPNTGNNMSVVRISIGASDLSDSSYTYNQSSGDVNMSNFSLDGPDTRDLIPILKKILAINPNIKVLATPWTAPTWMKTNNSYIGGRLQTQYYDAYARYFVKYLDAMKAEGIDIWAITPQNEPENPFNEPSMEMNADEQIDFINNHLGPAIQGAGYTTKIIAYDHNCDNLEYPKKVLNNSSFVDGAAFHLYDPEANIAGMSEVHDATGKNVYFTEQFTSSEGNFDGDFGWHMENVVLGSLNNWSKTVIEWNLANDTSFGPRTPDGCTTCLGAITINGSSSFTRNVSYYIIGQVSKFVQPNARHISTSKNILNTAFVNPDGSKVLVVYNRESGVKTISVNWNNKSFEYDVPARSAVTFAWTEVPTPICNPEAPKGLKATAGQGQVQLSWDEVVGADTYIVQRATTVDGAYTTLQSGISQTSYTDIGLTNGTTYYYRVQTVNSEGTSEASNSVSAAPIANKIDAFGIIEAESFTDSRGIQIENTSDIDGGSNVGFADTNDYLVFENVDFGTGIASVDVRIASAATFTGVIEIRLNDVTGPHIGTVPVGNTGGWQVWDTRRVNVDNVIGNKNVYLVFKGGEGIGNVNWFRFNKEAIVSPIIPLIPIEPPTNTTIISGGIYRIINKASGKSLDVTDISVANGAKLQQWEYSGGEHQKFRIDSVAPDAYSITAIHSGKALDVVDGSNAGGAQIQQWQYFGSPQQQWNLDLINEMYYEIASIHSGKVLQISGDSQSNGGRIIQNSRQGIANELWQFELVSSKKQSEEVINVSKIQLFPNPGDGDEVILRYQTTDLRPTSIVISDVLGRTVQQFGYAPVQKGVQTISLAKYMRKLSSGQYVIQVGLDTRVGRFVKL